MILHPEYKEYDAKEKELAKRECKKLFPVTEELKAHIRKKYEHEYERFIEQEVSVNWLDFELKNYTFRRKRGRSTKL